MGLVEKWRKNRAHTYSSENADHYRGFDAGLKRCADELEARDSEIRKLAESLLDVDGAKGVAQAILSGLGG